MLLSRTVRAEPLAGLHAANAISEGYSALTLNATSNYFDAPNIRIQNIAQVPAAAASWLQRKQVRIDPATRKRIDRMRSATRMAIDSVESGVAASDWMFQPNRTLVSAAPLESMGAEVCPNWIAAAIQLGPGLLRVLLAPFAILWEACNAVSNPLHATPPLPALR